MSDAPDTQEIPVPGGLIVRLTSRRLGDVPTGALITRRPPHQLAAELTGEAYDLAMGFSVRTTRPTDAVLAQSWVWQVELVAGKG